MPNPSYRPSTQPRPIASQGHPCQGVLVICRPGFERDAAGELELAADRAGLDGDVGGEPGSGIAHLTLMSPCPLVELTERFPLERLVFARQRLFWFDRLDGLSEGDRGSPLVAAMTQSGFAVSSTLLGTPDSDAAKPLSGFCRRFAAPFERLLDKTNLLRPKKAHLPQLQVVFDSPTTAWMTLVTPGDGSPWPMGLPRLRMPAGAPSRSTLKLAEAFMTLLTPTEQEQLLRPGRKAVDLGAAPGGWSWQLAYRGLHVTAIDNGPVAPSVLATGLVEHLRADGFTWRPKRPVDWMVCDMVDQPARVAQLISDWIIGGHCKRAIFNLKLPMKRRLEEVLRCRALIEGRLKEKGPVDLRFKQLYHDREEITGYITLRQ